MPKTFFYNFFFQMVGVYPSVWWYSQRFLSLSDGQHKQRESCETNYAKFNKFYVNNKCKACEIFSFYLPEGKRINSHLVVFYGISILTGYLMLNHICFDLSSDYPVSWGCRIHWLHLCRRVRSPPTSV